VNCPQTCKKVENSVLMQIFFSGYGSVSVIADSDPEKNSDPEKTLNSEQIPDPKKFQIPLARDLSLIHHRKIAILL